MMSEHSMTKIAVMGAGALGCYFGGRLAQSGAQVTLIARPAHVEAIRRDGLILESGGTKTPIKLDATTEPSGIRDAALVLVCVKSADTESAAKAIAPHLAKDAIIVSLQNSIGNVERIRAHADRPVAAGLVYTGANMPGPGHVRHTGGGGIVLGGLPAWGVNDVILAKVKSIFEPANVPIDLSPSIEIALWTKLMQNCAYNAVCALTEKPYGEMVAMPEVRAVMGQAGDEVVALAHRKGVMLDPGEVEAALERVKTMATTMSSTAQDLMKGKPTEIDYLNGLVARESKALGLAAPINAALAALVKLKEQKNRR
jgi:2-dehydropantoate 2-reductase